MNTNDIKTCDKVKILLITHGHFGEELINSAKMIIGDINNVKSVSLLPTHGYEDFKEIVSNELKLLGSNVLILTDILGGTPTNIAAMLSRENNIAALSGVNLAILIEAVTSTQYDDCHQLCKALKETGKNSIQDIIEWISSRS